MHVLFLLQAMAWKHRQLDVPRSQRPGSTVCRFLRVMASVISMWGNLLSLWDTLTLFIPQPFYWTMLCSWGSQPLSAMEYLWLPRDKNVSQIQIAGPFSRQPWATKTVHQLGILTVSGCKHERAVNFSGATIPGSTLLECPGTVMLTPMEGKSPPLCLRYGVVEAERFCPHQ